MTLIPTPIASVESRYVGREEAAKFCGISTRTFDRRAVEESFPHRRMICLLYTSPSPRDRG